MSHTVVSWEGVAAILAFVLLDVATGHPTYIGCNATVTAPHSPSHNQRLTADGSMKVMGGPIVTHPSDSLTVTDVGTNLAVQHYDVGGRSYRVTLVRDGSAPKVKAYCWSSHGSITQPSDAACPRYQRFVTAVQDVAFTWESPAGASPNVTLQCFYATGFGGGLSSASLLLGTQPEFFEAVAAAPNATVAGLAGTGCRNAGWVGTKEAQRWMYWGLVVLWAGMVARWHSRRSNKVVSLRLLLLAVCVFTTVWAASPFGGDSVPAMAALGIVLLVFAWWCFAFVPSKQRRSVLRSVATGAAATFLLVAWYTSFHHWCNGEQGWDEAHGSWGDYDTYQGTIPWWALSLTLALALMVPEPGRKLYGKHKWVFAFVPLWFCIALVVGHFVGGKGVAGGMIVACALPFILVMWWWRDEHGVAVFFIVAGVILSSALAYNSTSYSDHSTIVQMTWCIALGLAWVVLELVR